MEDVKTGTPTASCASLSAFAPKSPSKTGLLLIFESNKTS